MNKYYVVYNDIDFPVAIFGNTIQLSKYFNMSESGIRFHLSRIKKGIDCSIVVDNKHYKIYEFIDKGD